MGLYINQNADVIDMMCEHVGLPFEYGFRYKLDRRERTMTDEKTGEVYEIPQDMNLS